MTDTNDTQPSLYVRIRQWFQPYYQPVNQQATPKKAASRPRKQKSTATPATKAKRPAPEIRVFDYQNPLDNAIEFKNKPSANRVWCYHDRSRHQIFAHLTPHSGFEFRERDNAKRRKLEPMLHPTNVGVFDRTHVLPIGYHGSERDRRLLVGWDSNANRGKFEAFERKMKKNARAVYWYTSIERTKTGAKWTYRVYDVESLELVGELEDVMTATFAWKG